MSREKRKQAELLLPASSLEVLKTASDYGADVVYIDGEAFGPRTNAKNFSLEGMTEGLCLAHERGKRVYVTANTLAYNDDLDEVERCSQELAELGPDAIIVSDPVLFMLAKRSCPGTGLHVSTQANGMSYRTFLFWWEFGASCVVTARELSPTEIREIRERILAEMEIETFVHSAMCISYSGRCLLPSFMAGQDANRGEYTHLYRWQCSVTEEERPGGSMPIFEDGRGTPLLNPKDLCMTGHVSELVESGIDSFKIEGRMKAALHTAVTACAYRRATDDYLESSEEYAVNLESYQEEIGKYIRREYTTGFFFRKPNEEVQIYDGNTYIWNHIYLGKIAAVDAEGFARFEQESRLSAGDRAERTCFDGSNKLLTVLGIRSYEELLVESTSHSKEAPTARFSAVPVVGELLRAETAK